MTVNGNTTLIILLMTLADLDGLKAQSPIWHWAHQGGGAEDDLGYAVATDTAGNMFVAGSERSSAINFAGVMYWNASYPLDDGYVAKLDPAGNVLWFHGIHGTERDVCYDVCTDPDGNAYVTGFFFSSVIPFGPLVNVWNAGWSDLFIAKYDPSGNAVWATNIGSSNSEGGNSICSDASGNVMVAGTFSGATVTVGTTTLNNAGSADMLLAKYDPAGNVVWARSAGGAGAEMVYGTCTDGSGSTFVTGAFSGPTFVAGTHTLTGTGTNDAYLVKYDALGDPQWARSGTGSGNDLARSVCTDVSGNIYITGQFQDTIVFDTETLIAQEFLDMFLVKYDPQGNLLWARRYGDGGSITVGCGISYDGDGSLFITGSFATHPTEFGTHTLVPLGGSDIFVIKTDTSGAVLWAKGTGTANLDQGQDVCSDGNGHVYATGYFGHPTIDFDGTVFTGSGNQDAFVGSLDAFVGIGDRTLGQAFAVAPNPAADRMVVDLSALSGPLDLCIVDIAGQVIHRSPALAPASVVIDSERFADGTYFVQVRTRQGLTVQKVVVAR